MPYPIPFKSHNLHPAVTFSVFSPVLKGKMASIPLISLSHRTLQEKLHSLVEPNILDNCNSMDQLKQLHSQTIKKGIIPNPVLCCKIISFCCNQKSGSMDYARQVFDTIPEPKIFIWNIMFRGYSQFNHPKSAFSMYKEMLEKNVRPDSYTFPFLLKGFIHNSGLDSCKQIHVHVCKFGFESNVEVQHALIHTYSLCHQISVARGIFDMSSKSSAIIWNAMISGYNRSKQFDESRKLFNSMEKKRVPPTMVTLVSVLSACSKLKDLDVAKRVHQYIKDYSVKTTLALDNALVDAYAACGEMDIALNLFKSMKKRDVISWTSIVTGFLNSEQSDLARIFFDQMPERDSISWTAMISGYLRLNQFKEVLKLFQEMLNHKVEADEFIVVNTLTACAHLGAIESGEWIKAYIDKKRIKYDLYVGNALIDMYFKCGCVEKGVDVFYTMPHRDKFTYTAMIVGFAINGLGRKALDMFYLMLRASVRPDEITYIGVLSACTHTGLVNEGKRLFASMTTQHGIEPNVAHFGCMVDLLGRAGHLKEAYEVIRNMPVSPNSVIWGALLGACRVYKDAEMAEVAAKHLFHLEPKNEAAYVLLCNIYAVCNKIEKLQALRKIMTDSNIKKNPGCSSIEVNGTVHEFVAGDELHPQSKEIYRELEKMTHDLRSAGYTHDASEVLLDKVVEE